MELFFAASTFLLLGQLCKTPKEWLNPAGANKLCCLPRKAYFTGSRNKIKQLQTTNPPSHLIPPKDEKTLLYSIHAPQEQQPQPSSSQSWLTCGCYWPSLPAFGRLCPGDTARVRGSGMSPIALSMRSTTMWSPAMGTVAEGSWVVEARATLPQGKSTGREKCSYIGHMELETTFFPLSDPIFCF